MFQCLCKLSLPWEESACELNSRKSYPTRSMSSESLVDSYPGTALFQSFLIYFIQVSNFNVPSNEFFLYEPRKNNVVGVRGFLFYHYLNFTLAIILKSLIHSMFFLVKKKKKWEMDSWSCILFNGMSAAKAKKKTTSSSHTF